MYQHDYSGWEYLVIETHGISNIPSSKNNAVSAIKVRNGCTFSAYGDYNGQGPLFSITEDKDILRTNLRNKNDKLSSFSCSCTGEYYLVLIIT